MQVNHDLLLFDLDGTLSDPLVGIGRSINYALSHFGYESLELSSISAYVGPQIDETFMSITGIKEPRRVEDLVAKYRERYAEVGFSENTLYPGIPEVLSKLGANIPLAVCTSKRKDFAECILELILSAKRRGTSDPVESDEAGGERIAVPLCRVLES